MSDTQQDFAEIIQRKLQQVVRNKQGQVLLNEDGNPMTTMEAVAMSIVQNAMKGDTSSILLMRNLTKKSATTEELQALQKRNDDNITRYVQQIKLELEEDGLWFNQITSVEQIARMMNIAERLESMMLQPDYDDLIVDIKKDGTQSVRLNPLHERVDDLQRQIREELQKLKSEATKKKNLQRLNNTKLAI